MAPLGKRDKQIPCNGSNRSTHPEVGFLQPPSIRFQTASLGTPTSSERGSLRLASNVVTSIINNNTNSSNNTTSSFMDENTVIRPQSTASCSNISSRSEPPLTSTDALLIADTFRQRMRRPEWQHQQQQGEGEEDEQYDGETLEEEDTVSKRKKEEEKRRQLSEELLKKELAAEGTSMKKKE
ncbi:hypothetical protein DFQ30_004168 [Apophysomyces sp. BC1015]|nr:hypothetical protein DFQ30_004168 [Apophysomyces sp. BC1015]